MVRADDDELEMVRNVLGATWVASRCGPPDSVSPTRQRPHEEVIPLLSAWTQDQLGHRSFIVSKQIARGQLHVEDRRLAARRAGEEPGRLGDFEAIDRHRDLRRFRAARSRAYELLGPGLRRVVEKCPVEVVDEREKQRLPDRNRTGTDDSRRGNSRVSRDRAGQEPDLVYLPLGTIFARRIYKRVLEGRNPEHPLPPFSGPAAIGLTFGLCVDSSDAWCPIVIFVCREC